MELTITAYKDQDYQDWKDMALALFKDYPAEEIERGLKSILGKTNQQTFMAMDAGESVGFVSASIRVDYVEGATTSPVGYVDMVYVKEAYRKQAWPGSYSNMPKHGPWKKAVQKWVRILGCGTKMRSNSMRK